MAGDGKMEAWPGVSDSPTPPFPVHFGAQDNTPGNHTAAHDHLCEEAYTCQWLELRGFAGCLGALSLRPLQVHEPGWSSSAAVPGAVCSLHGALRLCMGRACPKRGRMCRVCASLLESCSCSHVPNRLICSKDLCSCHKVVEALKIQRVHLHLTRIVSWMNMDEHG